MADYRWNQLDNARGYDVAAEHVHPHYREVQDVILDALPPVLELPFALGAGLSPPPPVGWVIDLGGGSGRLAERILDRFPFASVGVVDQSDAFLTLARERLSRFGERAFFQQARLQSDWSRELPAAPRAIVSMSAIHHLDAGEKQTLYRQCAECLAPGGVLMNGDEVRPESDKDYLAECRRWAEHMHRVIAAGLIPEALQSALHGWEARNVGQFGVPRVSGDDCHETAATQLNYFEQAGLSDTRVLWQNELWAVLFGRNISTQR